MSRLTSRRLAVLALLVLALALRLGQVALTHYVPGADARSYLTLASSVAATGDYPTTRAAGSGAGGTKGPTAYFAPGYPYLLAAVDLISGRPHKLTGPARVAQAVLGTAVVGLTGLVATEACGAGPGLAALALAAVYPAFIELSAVLVAETLLTLLLLAATWATLRATRAARHATLWAAGAGALAGLATLTHENAIVAVLPLAVAAGRGLRRGRSRRLRDGAVLVLACLATIAPWTIRNAALLHRFVPVSDETGITLAGTYNPISAAATPPYRWLIYVRLPADRALGALAPRLTEPALSSRLTARALSYIGHHPFSPLLVALDNSRRLLELDGTFAWKASAYAVGIPTREALAGVAGFWLLALLALAGTVTAAARRAPVWLWALPVLLWLSVALVNGETPRFRAPIDPFLLTLAGCAVARAATYAVRQSGVSAGRRWREAIES